MQLVFFMKTLLLLEDTGDLNWCILAGDSFLPVLQVTSFLNHHWKLPDLGGQYVLPMMHKLKSLAGVVDEKISKKTLAQRTSEHHMGHLN